MSNLIDIKVPDIGDFKDVPVIEIFVKPGERVKAEAHYVTPNRGGHGEARDAVEAVLTAFFIAIHARFALELTDLPEGVEVVVFTIDTHPVSRYDDFSATEALITAGRENAEAVLDFWEAGGIGDQFTEPVNAVLASINRKILRDAIRGVETRGAFGEPQRTPRFRVVVVACGAFPVR